jgi:hypothetical protein
MQYQVLAEAGSPCFYNRFAKAQTALYVRHRLKNFRYLPPSILYCLSGKTKVLYQKINHL